MNEIYGVLDSRANYARVLADEERLADSGKKMSILRQSRIGKEADYVGKVRQQNKQRHCSCDKTKYSALSSFHLSPRQRECE